MERSTFDQLVPDEKRPETCHRLHCHLDLMKPGANQPGSIAVLRHTHAARFDEYPIPKAWVKAGWGYDLWDAEIKPWIVGLHETPAR